MLRDLGTRVHRVLLDHIRSHQFSDLGGIQLTCDLNEYDKTFSLFGDAFVTELIDTMKELARLLVVKADSVPQLISEGRLVRAADHGAVVWLSLCGCPSAKVEPFLPPP